MSKKRKNLKAQKRAQQKSKERENRLKKKEQPVPSAHKSNEGALRIERKGGLDAVTVDFSKLEQPRDEYIPNSFCFERFIGYTDLYFGQKSPRNRQGDLVNCVVVRVPNRLVKQLFIEDHEKFSTGLLDQIKITDQLLDQYRLDIENQFPISFGSQVFQFANFAYCAHSADTGKIMFYEIAPVYIHQIMSGQGAPAPPGGKGINGKLTITTPVGLLACFYHTILEKRDEY